MIDYNKLIPKLLKFETYEELQDCLALIDSYLHEDEIEVLGADYNPVEVVKNSANYKKAVGFGLKLRDHLIDLLKNGKGTDELEQLYIKTLLLLAKYNFDSFCLYIEKNREPRTRFYQPRRKQLLPLADALQKLEDNELDLLCISLPPGVGKTTIAIFFLAWQAGLHPELQNLISSHNNDFLRGVYDEILRVCEKGGDYCWADVFPNVPISGTNAKDMRIDFGKRKRFQTIQHASIEQNLAGKVRATNLLYCDDLVSGIEQAMSHDQMDKLWRGYSVNLKQRKIGNRCKELHIATRWSLRDPIGRLETLNADNPRALFINEPARDEEGLSNFDYPYGLGYTTKALDDLENSFDDASWKAIYMGQPIEREGQLYAPAELRRFFDLPEREPDAIIAVCDTKEQGDDFCSMPIVWQYGQDYYIADWICDNGKPDVIQERIVSKVLDKDVQMIRFESNRGGTIFAKNVQDKLKARGSHCKITTKWNQANKETRILVASAWVKEHCLFLDETLYAKTNKEYRLAMSQLTSYSMAGGRANKHDDVPDSLADLENFVKSFDMNRAEVFTRPSWL